MNELRLLNIILAPHVTEKTTRMGSSSSRCSQYAFKVCKDATKKEIKTAIKYLFKVTATSVRIVNMRAERCQVARRVGVHKGWKKAYITLAEGQQIDLSREIS